MYFLCWLMYVDYDFWNLKDEINVNLLKNVENVLVYDVM